MTAFNEILWIFLSQDNRNISVVNFIIGPIGGIIKSPGWRVIVMQFIFTSSNSSLSQKHQNCLKYLKHFEFDGCVTRSRVSLWLGSCSKLPYLIVWWRTETKETSFSLNLMIPQIPVVCCLKKCYKNISFILDVTQIRDIRDSDCHHLSGSHTTHDRSAHKIFSHLFL